jgi:hypothetical protein
MQLTRADGPSQTSGSERSTTELAAAGHRPVSGVVVSKGRVLGCLRGLPLDDEQQAGPERGDSNCVQDFHVSMFSNAVLTKYRR